MTQYRAAPIVLALALLVLVPTTQASLSTVLEDAEGDVRWEVLGLVGGPASAEPIRDALFLRNGTAADVQAIEIGENDTHVFVELDLKELPPAPDAGWPEGCGPEPWPQCGFVYRLSWTYFRAHDAWAPEVRLEWWMECRSTAQGGCSDSAGVRTPAGGFSGHLGLVAFERLPPDRARWTIDKVVFQQDEEMPPGTEAGAEDARLCSGDAFLNVRFEVLNMERWPLVPYHYFLDDRDTADTGTYHIQHDSPSCPDRSDPPSSDDRFKTVVNDPRGDARVLVADGLSTGPLVWSVVEPVMERNGSGVDVVEVRLGDNASRVVLEVDLAEAPPDPQDCAPGPGPDAPPRCGYMTSVFWTYYSRSGTPWGPEVNVTWRVACRPECAEAGVVRVGDGPAWSSREHPGVVRFNHLSPSTGRWTIDTSVFDRGVGAAGGEGSAATAGLCRGDAFVDFRFSAHAFEEFGLRHHRDESEYPPRGTHDRGFESYLVETGSETCTSPERSGAATVGEPALSAGGGPRSGMASRAPMGADRAEGSAIPGGTVWEAALALLGTSGLVAAFRRDGRP